MRKKILISCFLTGIATFYVVKMEREKLKKRKAPKYISLPVYYGAHRELNRYRFKK